MRTTSAKFIGIIIGVLAAGALFAFLYYFRGGEGAPSANFSGITNFVAGGSQESSEPPQEALEASASRAGWKTETNKKYGFSFQYPEEMKIGSVPSPEGTETIVVEKEGPFGFQIFISPYDKPHLTVEQIKTNIYGIIVEQPQILFIGGKSQIPNPKSQTNQKSEIQNLKQDGTQGLAFFSRDDSIGRTREVWFVHQGRLYQITAYAEFSEQLFEILETWKFSS